jgi:hypothetical protein
MATQEVQKSGFNATLKKAFVQPFRPTKSRQNSKNSTSSPTTEASPQDELLALPNYKYSSLDKKKKSVRLLEVLPGPYAAPIKCKVVQCDLDENPTYIALSYMWSQGTGKRYIDCQGTKISIGDNLWQFFREFRKNITIQEYLSETTATPVRLWIDAICIDQTNIEERNQQVTLMRDVYTGADHVIVWLGLAKHSEELAFLLTRFPNMLEVNEIAMALIELLNKPYWGRVWVIQEFVLAKSVEIWCGEFRADASKFEHIWREDQPLPGVFISQQIYKSSAWLLFKYRREFKHTKKYKRDVLGRRNSRTLKATFRLRDLIQTFSFSESTEMYDRVYGFLGIASTGRGEKITPDYSKTSVELLVDVIRNQCHGSTKKDEEENHKLLMYLMRTLKVSRIALARYLLSLGEELEPHIYVLAVSRFMAASLSFIGQVVEVGSSVQRDEAFGDAMWSTNALSRSDMHPSGLSPIDIRDLGSLAGFSSTRRALKFEDYHIPGGLHQGKAEKLRQRVIATATANVIESLSKKPIETEEKMSRKEKKKSKTDKECSPEEHTLTTEEIRKTFSSSITAAARLVQQTRLEVPDWDTQGRFDQCTTFVGANDIIGIFTTGGPDSPQLMPDDVLCAFTDETISNKAMVLRRDEAAMQWNIIGFAVVITSLSDSKPLGMVRSFTQAFSKAAPQTRTEFDISNDIDAGQQTVCFHCHLTDVLELHRCDILNDSQLDRLLEMSLRDEADDETHQCRHGTGKCDVLEFGM